MHKPVDWAKPLTELEISAIWDEAASEVCWVRRQMLFAEGLDPDLERGDSDDEFRSLFPITAFGSDLWLKRQILPVLCLAYQDIEEALGRTQARASADPDKYVRLIIPARHRKFLRLVMEMQEKLPWIAAVLDPDTEPTAVAVHQRLKHLGLGSKVRIRYADLNEVRFVV